MDGAMAALRHEFASLRTGPRLGLDAGAGAWSTPTAQQTPINQVGTVNVPEPRMVTINVWDKGMVSKVEKAIRESGLGINPQINGTIIMLPIPELNEERRRELTKVAAQYAEHARVAIRNVRRDGMDQIKKAKAAGMSRGRPEDLGRRGPGPDRRAHRAGRRGAGDQAGRDHAGLTARLGLRARRRRRWPPARPETRPAPRRHHHGRQRPLGAARAAGRGCSATTPARERVREIVRGLPGPRRQVPDDLRLLDRELEAHPGRGRRA